MFIFVILSVSFTEYCIYTYTLYICILFIKLNRFTEYTHSHNINIRSIFLLSHNPDVLPTLIYQLFKKTKEPKEIGIKYTQVFVICKQLIIHSQTRLGCLKWQNGKKNSRIDIPKTSCVRKWIYQTTKCSFFYFHIFKYYYFRLYVCMS